LKLIRNTRGLSPIIASVIILSIVTTLFIPVFIWTTGLTAETKSFWENIGSTTTERLVIEEVNLRDGLSSCTIYVRNIGKTAIVLDNIFIVSIDGSMYVYSKPRFSTDLESVIQGDLMTVNIPSLDFVPSSGETYTIKVFTTRGVGDAYQIVA
jgi:hypothetical protein